MAPTRGRQGRPTDYSPKFPEWVRALARRGLSEKEIAKEIGIARSTLKEWEKEYPDFSDALQEGKSHADSLVENALFRRAVGFETEEKKIIATPERDAKGETVTKSTRIEKTTKQVLPDVGAITLWLKNRRPDLWRDLPKPDPGGGSVPEDTATEKPVVDVDSLTEKEAKTLIELLTKIENAADRSAQPETTTPDDSRVKRSDKKAAGRKGQPAKGRRKK